MLKKLLTAISFVVLTFVMVAPLPAQQLVGTYYWSAPTIGSVPQSYRVYQSLDGAAFTLIATVPHENITTDIYTGMGGKYVMTFPIGKEVVLQVAAVDAAGREGVRSPSSDPYEDAGPPGGCGAPFLRF